MFGQHELVLDYTASSETLQRLSSGKRVIVHRPDLRLNAIVYIVPGKLKRLAESCQHSAERAARQVVRLVLRVAEQAAAAVADISAAGGGAAGSNASGVAAMDVDGDSSSVPMEVDSSCSSPAAAAALAESAATAAAGGSSTTATSSSSTTAGEHPLVALPWCGLVLLPSQVAAACSGMAQQQSSAAAAEAVSTAVVGDALAATAARGFQERAAEAILLVKAARTKLAAEAAAATAGGVAEKPWDKQATTELLKQAQQDALASEQLVQQHSKTAELQLREAAGQWQQVRRAPRISSSALNSCIRYHDLEHTALPAAATEQRGLCAVLVAASEAVPMAACVQPLVHQISKRAVTAAPALCAVAAAKPARAGSSADTTAVAVTVCAFNSNGTQTKLSCSHYSATVSATSGSAVATVLNTFKTVRSERGKQAQQQQQQQQLQLQQQKPVARITNSIMVSKYFTPETEELVGSVVHGESLLQFYFILAGSVCAVVFSAVVLQCGGSTELPVAAASFISAAVVYYCY
jgi:hypothetical protein